MPAVSDGDGGGGGVGAGRDCRTSPESESESESDSESESCRFFFFFFFASFLAGSAAKPRRRERISAILTAPEERKCGTPYVGPGNWSYSLIQREYSHGSHHQSKPIAKRILKVPPR